MSQSQTVFISELHYDDTNTNAGGNNVDNTEGVEISGPAGTNLIRWNIEFYNTGGGVYNTIPLSGSIPDQGSGFGAFTTLTQPLVQDSINDGNAGLALINDLGQVVEFISYGGVITATGGTANGMISTNLPVIESATNTPQTFSLQRFGTGFAASQFQWTGPQINSFGSLNTTAEGPLILLQAPSLSLQFEDPALIQVEEGESNVELFRLTLDDAAPLIFPITATLTVDTPSITLSDQAGNQSTNGILEVAFQSESDTFLVIVSSAENATDELDTTQVTIAATATNTLGDANTFSLIDNEIPGLIVIDQLATELVEGSSNFNVIQIGLNAPLGFNGFPLTVDVSGSNGLTFNNQASAFGSPLTLIFQSSIETFTVGVSAPDDAIIAPDSTATILVDSALDQELVSLEIIDNDAVTAPDLAIGILRPSVGRGTISPSPASQSVNFPNRRTNQPREFRAQVQNGGNINDSYRIRATASNQNFINRYFVFDGTNFRNATAQIIAGNQIAQLAPGEIESYKGLIRPRPSIRFLRRATTSVFTAQSAERLNIDRVRIRVVNLPFPRPR